MNLNRFNPRQREAITHVGSPLLVLAGAGNGKTSIITHKIAWLIQEARIPARHITAVTFTNKASREILKPIRNVAPKNQIRGLNVSTSRTFGLSLLQSETACAGLKSEFSILDAEDAKSVLLDLLKRESIDDRDVTSSVQHTISYWKNDGLSPHQAMLQATNPQSVLAASPYVEYDRYLKACNAVDLNNLILRPVGLFRNKLDLLVKWQATIRYLLVDEYQDTNGIQHELVKRLTQISGALTIVCDDNQSIYAWRGTRPENLSELKVDFPTRKLIELEQNYRSTRVILETANALIANNPHMFGKTFWSDKGFGDRIEILPTKTDANEAERIASMILERRLNQKKTEKNFQIFQFCIEVIIKLTSSSSSFYILKSLINSAVEPVFSRARNS